MKLMSYHLVLVVVVTLVLVCGSLIEAQTWKDPHCADVAWYFYPCVDYLGGLDVAPSKACCDQLKDLNTIALKEKKGTDRICLCILNTIIDEAYHIISSRADALTNKCYVHNGPLLFNFSVCSF
ncbi:hypothetical protein Dsin_031377 [Dipteronia sinensis]|uniref:Bifunctional inhibitor/plant lipid transfer protein/seed storage helical domain-containing protein n=1 Tax=Dipteronia sinensis TaxID=43782 RepID=A0AAD9ZL98_9ROSI|nr:hypothetical protein Dsin_031377 [Dipteronia sinensis]